VSSLSSSLSPSCNVNPVVPTGSKRWDSNGGGGSLGTATNAAGGIMAALMFC